MEFKEKVCKYIIDKPKQAFGLFVLLNLLILPGLVMVKTDFTYQAWYNQKDPQVQTFNRFEDTFGNDDNLFVLLKDPNGIVQAKNLQAIADLTDLLWETREIIRVDSLTNNQYIDVVDDDLLIEALVDETQIDQVDLKDLNRKIDREPMLEGYFISKDRKSSLVQAFVRPATDTIPDHSAITQDVRGTLDKFKKKYPHLEVHLTGPVTVVDDFTQATLNDMMLLIPLLYLAFSILLYYKYRSPLTIGLIFYNISASTALMLGLAGFADLKINSLTSACPTILMTIALSDAVHIFSSFFVGLKNNFTIESSLFYSLKKNFYPTLLTSFTTALGFASFGTAKIMPVSDLGLMVAGGVVFAWLVTYFALAPLILFTKKRFEKFQTGHTESLEVEKEIPATPEAIKNSLLIRKYRFPILGVTAILALASFVYIPKIEVNMDPIKQFFPDHPSVIARDFVNDNYGFSSSIEISVDSGMAEGAKNPEFLKKVETYINWIENDPAFAKVTSIVPILKSLNKSLNQDQTEYYTIPKTQNLVAESLFMYTLGLPQGKDLTNLINLDNRKLHLSAQWKLTDSKSCNAKIKELEEKAKEMGLDIELTGKTLLFHELTPYIVQTFIESISLALIGITLTLIISLRSFALGILALIPNVFPLLVGGLIFYFTGYDMDTGTVIVASVCLGIAVDDSIHFLFEYQRYRESGESPLACIQKILTSTFPALSMTTVLISVGFLSFIFGSYIPNMKFGVSVAIILLIALIADFVILPAILMLKERT